MGKNDNTRESASSQARIALGGTFGYLHQWAYAAGLAGTSRAACRYLLPMAATATRSQCHCKASRPASPALSGRLSSHCQRGLDGTSEERSFGARPRREWRWMGNLSGGPPWLKREPIAASGCKACR